MNFPCTKCGACCRRNQLLPSFLYPDVDGKCIKLTDNKCSIYEQRPDVCNITKIKELVFKGTLVEYYRASAIICNQLIKEDGISSDYLIDLTQFKD